MGQTRAVRGRPGKTSTAAELEREDDLQALGNQDTIMALAQMRSVTEERVDLTPEIWQLMQTGRDVEQNPALAGEHETGTEWERQGGTVGQALPVQGALQDTSLFAAMYSIAKNNPNLIRDLIRDNGDGTYDVRLFVRDDVWSFSASEQVITISGDFPMWAGQRSPLYGTALSGEEGPALWAMLIEKAYAVHQGSYEDITDSALAQDASAVSAMTLLTGRREQSFDPAELGEEATMQVLAEALSRGWAAACTVKNLDEVDDDVRRSADRMSVVSGHTYAPTAIDVTQGKMELHNPWGALHLHGLGPQDFLRFFTNIRICRLDGVRGASA